MMRDHLTLAGGEAAEPAITEVGDAPLTLGDLIALAQGRAHARVTAGALARMQASADVVAQILADEGAIYGITTGVGASVVTAVPRERAAEFSLNLLRMHGCGTGRTLGEDAAAAVLATRLASLTRGASGVRPVVAERLAALLNARVLPVIPEEGSVGASGDLTPLSYVAAVLVGEREVLEEGRAVPAGRALTALGLEPLVFGPKEALALMNGTSVATAIGILAWAGARRLARLAAAVTAVVSESIGGNPSHFDAFIHALKPHPGQELVARWVSQDLGPHLEPPTRPARLQDRYSIRCAPHVVGVLVDSLLWTEGVLETELNGVSDNPVVDVERGIVLHGGNFYGGHVAQAFDMLKTAVANIADLLDRQLLLLCSPAENGGLPENLVGVPAPESATHHGFKAMGIATSALTAEALKLTMPASAFSRSTELHNQDKVPMATIAARDLTRIVELTEQVGAICLLAACQAAELRAQRTPQHHRGPRTTALLEALREHVPALEGDRRMDVDIQAVLALLRADELPLGSAELA